MKVRKAVIPTTPSCTLPLLNRSVLSYVLDEVFLSGFEHAVIVETAGVSPQNHCYGNDYWRRFDRDLDAGSIAELCAPKPLTPMQALWAARFNIGNEIHALLMPDEVYACAPASIAQLTKIALQEKCNIIAVREIEPHEAASNTVIRIKKQITPALCQVKDLVVNPTSAEAPSPLALAGRCILSSDVFDILDKTIHQASEEFTLVQVLQELVANGEKLFAYKLPGLRYDVSTPQAWLESNVAMALRHPEFTVPTTKFLQTVDRDFLIMQGMAHSLQQKELQVRR